MRNREWWESKTQRERAWREHREAYRWQLQGAFSAGVMTLDEAEQAMGRFDMGKNDWCARPDGSMRRGDLGLEVLERQREMLADRIQTIKEEALPMQTGKGFIVVAANNPRFDGREFEKIEGDGGAQEAADELAYQTGKAIIYAPIAIVKPKRETATVQPSDLLKQLTGRNALPSGQVADIDQPK